MANDDLRSCDPGAILLPANADFVITRISAETYDRAVNVTYRTPRKRGEAIIPLVVTTTVEVDNLTVLRVEETDGQVFIVNDGRGYRDKLRFSVMSADTGYRIIRGLLDVFAPCVNEESIQTNPLPEKYRGINKMVEEIAPSIGMVCEVLIIEPTPEHKIELLLAVRSMDVEGYKPTKLDIQNLKVIW